MVGSLAESLTDRQTLIQRLIQQQNSTMATTHSHTAHIVTTMPCTVHLTHSVDMHYVHCMYHKHGDIVRLA